MSDEIEKADLGRFCNNVLSALMSSMSEKSRGYKHVFVSTRKIGDKFKAVAVRTSYGEVLKEAASRLRNVSVRSDNSAVIAYPVNNNGSFGGRARNQNPCTTIKDANGEVLATVIGSPVRNRSDAMRITNEICQSLNTNAILRDKLKVAEDALVKLQDRLVSSVHDGTIDPHAALEIAEDALSAIREEGSAK